MNTSQNAGTSNLLVLNNMEKPLDVSSQKSNLDISSKPILLLFYIGKHYGGAPKSVMSGHSNKKSDTNMLHSVNFNLGPSGEATGGPT